MAGAEAEAAAHYFYRHEKGTNLMTYKTGHRPGNPNCPPARLPACPVSLVPTFWHYFVCATSSHFSQYKKMKTFLQTLGQMWRQWATTFFESRFLGIAIVVLAATNLLINANIIVQDNFAQVEQQQLLLRQIQFAILARQQQLGKTKVASRPADKGKAMIIIIAASILLTIIVYTIWSWVWITHQ